MTVFLQFLVNYDVKLQCDFPVMDRELLQKASKHDANTVVRSQRSQKEDWMPQTSLK